MFYRWHAANANSSAQYTFGAAFPARLVPEGALLTETPKINFNFENLCPWLFCLGFAGFTIFSIYTGIVGDRKRKLKYLPPKVSVEGNGIKRGLTAVEAALLMEQPMDKILTMILFSVVKKGAAQVVTRDPMKLEITQPAPADMRTYETDFLTAMAFEKPVEQRRALQDMMTNLVKSVSEKMRGFSRKETVAYYQDIMNKAWQQVEQADTPEMKMQMFDDAMDWTMLDRRFDDRTRDTFGPRPVILPGWWWRFDPTIGGGARPTVSTSGPRAIRLYRRQPPSDGYFHAQPAWLRFRGLDGHGHAGICRQRGRRPDRLYRRRNAENQPTTRSYQQRDARWRRRAFLRLCLCVRRLRLRLRRRRAIRTARHAILEQPAFADSARLAGQSPARMVTACPRSLEQACTITCAKQPPAKPASTCAWKATAAGCCW